VQDEAIILTESTFSLGALDELALDDAAAPVELGDDADSTVPVTSTLWPTCGVSLLSSPSSL
jgi:hypothetical protein